jgi:antitoxin (DNA-binding transcriptional repressor) of toxin-antitoxin stability system
VKILVDVTEAAERLEELIELALRGDEIVICREEIPVAMLTPIAQKIASYDEHGLPK